MKPWSFRIEPGPQHAVIARMEELEGYIRFRVPESINAASVNFDPPGVCTNPWQAAESGGDIDCPVVWRRGPEIMLQLDREEECTVWREISADELQISVTNPGVFDYRANIKACGDSLTVNATLANESKWDWRDAYVYFCCGVDPCPAFADHTGERTVLFTADGPRRVSELRRRVWADFRPTAQYFEADGRPMPKTPQGFAFDECGISPDKVTAGLILREAQQGQPILAVATRRFRAIFMDLGEENNCIHANPSAGDLLAGEVASLQGSLFILRGTPEEVAVEAARRAGILLNTQPEQVDVAAVPPTTWDRERVLRLGRPRF